MRSNHHMSFSSFSRTVLSAAVAIVVAAPALAQNTTAAIGGQITGADGKPVANTFTVTADAGMPDGIYEVRSVGKYGLSNPRSFLVGSRVEAQEVEPNNTKETATKADVNSTVNARSNGATDIDWYKVGTAKPNA